MSEWLNIQSTDNGTLLQVKQHKYQSIKALLTVYAMIAVICPIVYYSAPSHMSDDGAWLGAMVVIIGGLSLLMLGIAAIIGTPVGILATLARKSSSSIILSPQGIQRGKGNVMAWDDISQLWAEDGPSGTQYAGQGSGMTYAVGGTGVMGGIAMSGAATAMTADATAQGVKNLMGVIMGDARACVKVNYRGKPVTLSECLKYDEACHLIHKIGEMR